MNIIVLTVSIVSIIGLLIGLFLGFSNNIFKVEVDEKQEKIRECLPGNNCGGCGYAGCDSLAEAIAKNEASVDACPVGGSEVSNKIANILGVNVEEKEKMVAFVNCNGTCQNAKNTYSYDGFKDCLLVSTLPNMGEKYCQFSCIGYGSCVKVCKFNAIHIVNGVALVNKNNCTSCKACINICPKKVISLVPFNKKHLVTCSSKEKGKVVKDNCSVGCISCKICEKNCKDNAIVVTNNLAVMDFNKCTDCGICAEKCPQKCIS